MLHARIRTRGTCRDKQRAGQEHQLLEERLQGVGGGQGGLAGQVRPGRLDAARDGRHTDPGQARCGHHGRRRGAVTDQDGHRDDRGRVQGRARDQHRTPAEPVGQPALRRRRGGVAQGGRGHRDPGDGVRAGGLVQHEHGGQRHHALRQACQHGSRRDRPNLRPGEQGAEGGRGRAGMESGRGTAGMEGGRGCAGLAGQVPGERAAGHGTSGGSRGTQRCTDVALPGFYPFRCPPPGGSRRSDQPGPQEAGGTLTASSR